jgi:hypothetical protein
VTKTWEELAKEAGGDSDFAKKLDGIPGKERASMGGPVATDTTYESWFAEQDRERQLEILGPGRMGMYERGTLGFSDMVNMAGKPMTLGELQEKQEKVADKPEHEIFFEKAVKEVLEKIECPVPIELGDLEAIRKKEYDKRPWTTFELRDTTLVFGTQTSLSNSPDGERVPCIIGINEKYVKKWFEKGTLGKYEGDDGRYYNYEQLTAEQQLKIILCHEIAHARQTDTHTKIFRKLKGHTVQHQKLMYKYISLVCPEVLSIPRRIRWDAPRWD